MLLFGFGMGLNFVTATLTAVSGVAQHEAGAASGLLNATQQVGGSLGLSILITVFGTASRDEADKQVPLFMAQADGRAEGRLRQDPRSCRRPGAHEVLAQGISTAFVAGRRDGRTRPGHRAVRDQGTQERPGGPQRHGRRAAGGRVTAALTRADGRTARPGSAMTRNWSGRASYRRRRQDCSAVVLRPQLTARRAASAPRRRGHRTLRPGSAGPGLAPARGVPGHVSPLVQVPP